jgi:hypothetical protein
MARTLILLYFMLALLAGALGTKHRKITATKASSQASSPSAAAAAAAATRRLLEQGHKGSQDTKRSPVLGLCYSRYSAFLPSIHEDLMSWSGAGITEAMMDEVLMERTFFEGWMGIPIIIKGGIPYMVGNRNASGIAPWFRTEFMIYSQVIIDLTKRYGKDIPDVEFVIMTDDEPGPLIDQDNMPPLPYFRWEGQAAPFCVLLNTPQRTAVGQARPVPAKGSAPALLLRNLRSSHARRSASAGCIKTSQSRPPPALRLLPRTTSQHLMSDELEPPSRPLQHRCDPHACALTLLVCSPPSYAHLFLLPAAPAACQILQPPLPATDARHQSPDLP